MWEGFYIGLAGKRIISQVNITLLTKILFSGAFISLFFKKKTTNIPELNQFASFCDLNSSFLLFFLSTFPPSFLSCSFFSFFIYSLPLLPHFLPPPVKKLFMTLVKDAKGRFLFKRNYRTVVGATAMKFYSRREIAQLNTTKKSGALTAKEQVVETSDGKLLRESIRDKRGF